MADKIQLTPNVINEQGLRLSLKHGGQLEIECREEPFRKGPSWHGLWFMKSIDPSGEVQMLVTARMDATRGGFKVREFKTATGIISFLSDCGFAAVHFPLRAGDKTTLRLQLAA
ncbi:MULTISPECIES: hypothetical protein [Rhodobacterales]|uniref:Uncharacterized protein n=2 Tax=Alphaproteobacteria TaxID=28211 RepID=A0A9Q2P844_9RHOB|nr:MULTISPECIES: hypothetical protein [Rhodobacterales]MBM1222775.1 hypothetical protein [Ponticoccus sp. SC6-9]MBM1227399.1 hypothetical protein [Ponticoccus sp. SC6-15]MBM1231701.1 hypothetical protein [Ponticoccus sp. SC6-38]MBM1236274.1 hypothetical protein [Ponticoccus sp. SC6-45]MBM1240724.1 hypothetical protein [Ponticoccus sp. SC6-49]MBM1245259.1 hypothetical protein [Ponticoccus sp. SC2-64]MBM1249747.1 hypothetical protein [Ponticoccus sp. SC6-42]MBM1254217.1 hypothetical protein [